MTRLADAAETIATLRAVASAPTAPFHEAHALAAIVAQVEREGIDVTTDAYAQVYARVRRGDARPIVFVAHTDHPAFEITSARGNEGSARVLGGFRGNVLDDAFGVRIYDDHGGGPIPATLDRFVPDADPTYNSGGRMRVRAEGKLEAGQWAVLDLPPFEPDGERLRLAAADDLAGCTVIALALRALAASTFPVDAIGVFTRAEEAMLYGARLIAEEGSIPHDALVISVEASRELPHVRAGAGPVVRVGDLHNTFTNDAERYIRAAAEHLARDGVQTQRALLDGGTCEGSTFVVNGWDTTAIAVPNVNYHNRGPDDRFAAEIVHLEDVRGAVALLVQTAQAVAEDRREAWWTTAGPVPDEVKTKLRAFAEPES